MIAANNILLCLLWLGITFASSFSGCDTSSTMEVVQTISGPINIFYVGIVSPDWCTAPSYTEWDPAVTLPRFTWTLEPAPEGATNTTVMMSPPDLGTLLYDLNKDGVGSADGLKINPTLNLTNGTEVGIVVQIPRNELVIVNVLGGAPFYVNIVNGFTNISTLGSDIGSYDFYCGNGTYQSDIFGRGSSVAADLSSAIDFWSLSIRDDGANWAVTLTDDETSRTELEIDAMNAKVAVQGHLQCTEPYACNLIGGSREGCAENCQTELVVDGSISGNISVFSITPQPPFWEEYEGNATFIITTSDAGGCDHFVLDDIGETPFECTVDTGVVVEVQEFPCTISAGEGGPTDTLQCHGESYEGRHMCNCAAPGTCLPPSPTPTPSSPSSFVKPHWFGTVQAVSLIMFCSTISSFFF